jgi:CxxC motif-containing protein
MATEMSCVLCPRGHAVAVGNQTTQLTCPQCKQTFPFEQGDVQRRLMAYDSEMGVWKEEPFKTYPENKKR